MIQATKPTLTFGMLVLIAAGLVGAVIYLNQQLKARGLIIAPEPIEMQKGLANAPAMVEDEEERVSTDNWKVYSDSEVDLSFKYPSAWKVQTYYRTDFNIIVLTPNQGKDKIRIYVSDDEYVGLDGLQTSPITVGGERGVNASDMVVGVKEGQNYFTFDAGQDQKLLPEFKGIIRTVAFGN